MSVIQPSDRNLHYSDSSHRWIAPYDVDQATWEAGMRAHLERHLSTMGGHVIADLSRETRSSARPWTNTARRPARKTNTGGTESDAA